MATAILRSAPARALAGLLIALLVAAVPARAELDLDAALAQLGIDQPIPPEGKAIVVNIPGFELVAVENGKERFRSRVIVGAPWHATPIRAATVSAVRFRPTWRPTPSMIASGEYRDRVWPPGENNPLGLAAVRLDPGFLVYLHDTNRRELFDREMRALSHGCVRVERWEDLVAFVLDWDLDAVRAAAAFGPTRDVAAPPIPVVLGYFPVFPDATGAPRRHADIYGLGGPVAPGLPPPPPTQPVASEAGIACPT